eukprot:scaffold20627_cov96-Isochrysis_galbana.AAC.1
MAEVEHGVIPHSPRPFRFPRYRFASGAAVFFSGRRSGAAVCVGCSLAVRRCCIKDAVGVLARVGPGVNGCRGLGVNGCRGPGVNGCRGPGVNGCRGPGVNGCRARVCRGPGVNSCCGPGVNGVRCPPRTITSSASTSSGTPAMSTCVASFMVPKVVHRTKKEKMKVQMGSMRYLWGGVGWGREGL